MKKPPLAVDQQVTWGSGAPLAIIVEIFDVRESKRSRPIKLATIKLCKDLVAPRGMTYPSGTRVDVALEDLRPIG